MTDSRPAPYPADTRAKGWRFELDYERIDQSDTWDIAAEVPMAQHALLFMWLTAWRQEPCGSLPNDEALIRAKCRIPASIWESCRDICMRGWWLADDGRLYHDTITARVLEMQEYRRKEAERRNRNRGKPSTDPELSRGTNAGQQPGSHGTPDTGTGTGTSSSPTSKKKARAAPPAIERPADVDEQVWSDWLALRKAKKAPVTQTVLDGAIGEAGKAGMSLEAFLRIWCRRGTQGLEADWLKPHERAQSPPGGETPRERAAREKVFRMTGGILGAKPYGAENRDSSNIIDIEPAAGHAALG